MDDLDDDAAFTTAPLRATYAERWFVSYSAGFAPGLPSDPTAWDTQAPAEVRARVEHTMRQEPGREFYLGLPPIPHYRANVLADAAATADGDVRPPPDAPIDRVLGDLAADRIGTADRRRLDDAIGAANKREDGTTARPDEAFGRILRGAGGSKLGIVTP